MILCGIQVITSKKDNRRFMRLHLTEESEDDKETSVGLLTSSEFVPYDSKLFDLLGLEVKIYYRKSYNGSAVVDTIVPA